MADGVSETNTGSGDLQKLCASLANVKVTMTQEELAKKISQHLTKILAELSQHHCKPVILTYLRNVLKQIVDESTSKKESLLVEYIFVPEDRNQAPRRDRLNSCSISLDVSAELSKRGNTESETVELPLDLPPSTKHYCNDCDVEITVSEGEGFRSALIKHFSGDAHKAEPKPEIVLPTVSRKMAALMRAEPAGKDGDMLTDNVAFKGKLTEALLNVEPGRPIDVGGLLAVYAEMAADLMSKVPLLDLSTVSKIINPILVSIKDNVNQSSAENARVNEEEDDYAPDDPNAKGEPKKLKFYQPIASKIDDFLSKHKLILLTDERGGKPAYFCAPCEYYTLRFAYETVMGHVLSEAHITQLSLLLKSDMHISHSFPSSSPEDIYKFNSTFLSDELWVGSTQNSEDCFNCKICKLSLMGLDTMTSHLFDEVHMGKLSGKFFFKMRDDKTINWGAKSTDWKRFNLRNGKTLSENEHVVLENFVTPLAKTLTQCRCCTATLKGQRQLVFNHVRQKKHLRNAIPRRLTIAFSNFIRPAEFYSSFGHYYTCVLCEAFPQSVMLNFSDIFEHGVSELHLTAVAKLLRIYSGNYTDLDTSSLLRQTIMQTDIFSCILCGVQFVTIQDVVAHVFTDITHHNNVAARDFNAYKPHIANYLLKNSPIVVVNNEYLCMVCNLIIPTNSGLLAHLSLADHVTDKMQPEAVFRFYLILKYNTKLCKDNFIVVRDQTAVDCQKCNCSLAPEEDIRMHITSAKHKG